MEQEQANNFNEHFFFGRYRGDCFVSYDGNKDRLDDVLSFLIALECDVKFPIEIEQDC